MSECTDCERLFQGSGLCPECRTRPVCSEQHCAVGWTDWTNWEVLLDGELVRAVEACAVQGWAEVWNKGYEGTRIVYGHVVLRRKEFP